MRIAFTTLACPDWPIDKIISAAVENRYDGVDFRGYMNEMELWKLPEFSSHVERTADAFSAAHVAVPAFSSSVRLCSDQAEEVERFAAEVAQYARLCEVFGAKYIRVFMGGIGQRSYEAAGATALENCRRFAEIAAPAVLAVETHDEWVNSAEMAKWLHQAAGPQVTCLWDLHHPYRMLGEAPALTYGRLGRYIGYTHFKDSTLLGADGQPLGPGKYRYCLGGEGDVPLAEMLRLLKGGGYSGWVTLEWEKKWHPDIEGPEVALPAYADYMRRLVASLP